MVEYIDKQAAINSIRGMEDIYVNNLPPMVCKEEARMELAKLPSVDVVEVVRCKYCKHWHDAPTADGYNSCEMDALIRHEMFFCANGERKDG